MQSITNFYFDFLGLIALELTYSELAWMSCKSRPRFETEQLKWLIQFIISFKGYALFMTRKNTHTHMISKYLIYATIIRIPNYVTENLESINENCQL